MTFREKIENRLQAEFSPRLLNVIDESSRHEGHAGSKPGGESHFAVEITSDKFTGKNRLERQRMVFSALKNELESQIHALRFIALKTPDEQSDK